MSARNASRAGILALALLSGAVTPGCAAAGPEVLVRDLEGEWTNPFGGAPALVLVFADPQCPISNAYAPELRRLHEEFAPRGVRFWLVYADPTLSEAELRAHRSSFGYPMPALFDREHALVRRAGATLTPEACVFDSDGRLAYRGRIDDRYFAFGKQRPAPTTRDLQAAVEAVLAGERPATPWPPAIGCAIPGVTAAAVTLVPGSG